MENTNVHYQDSILEAMEIVANNTISTAGYDKTIQAKIINCVDPTIGKYKVQYQDSTFFAYSIGTDYVYNSDIMVWVLIAANDMRNDKTILGTVDKLGTDYIYEQMIKDYFEIIGNNCFKSDKEFKMCSYGGNQKSIIYDKEQNINLIELDINDVENYIKNASWMRCGVSIKTALPTEQQLGGDYGIVFEMAFKDNATEEVVLKQYEIGANSVLGNPYKLVNYTEQERDFKIDGENFLYVNKIYLYIENFPNTAPEKPEDIFFKNLKLYKTVELNKENLDTTGITFITPQGIYFTEEDPEDTTKLIQAQIKIKGKNIDSNSQNFQYYWFIENANITSASEKYCEWGGPGWACLNEFNVVKTDSVGKSIVEWVPASWEKTISKAECLAKETTFKCVAIINEKSFEKEIVITNPSTPNITIKSSGGTQFYYDNGNPNLICYIDGVEQLDTNYTYLWTEVDNNKKTTTLNETTAENDEYNTAKLNYDNLTNDIKNEVVGAEAAKQRLEEYLTVMKKYDKITRVERNKIFSLAINKITNFSTYKCSVYNDGIMIGTASIVIYNNLKNADYYNLVLNNGTQVFNYNANGISPTNDSIENKMILKPLTFNIYDNLGTMLSDEVLKKSKIKWVVPNKDTLIKIPDKDGIIGIIDNEKNVVTYENLLELEYQIEDNYDISKKNNTITLYVDYKGIKLMTQTNFTFIKDGEPGTNGTEFTCIIVPNTDIQLDEYPMISNGELNYIPKEEGKWFRLQLWHNGKKIFEGADSGNSIEDQRVEITWSNLLNKYDNETSDSTNIKINNNIFEYVEGYGHTANIIKCTVVYQGITYYSTLPLITARVDNGYKISLKKNTGFRFVTYSADGRNPQYDNSNSFEIIVKKRIDGIEEDISCREGVVYGWSILGQIYNPEKKIWRDQNLLIDMGEDDTKNKEIFKPVDNYNGECLNISLHCRIWYDSTSSSGNCNIYIPIHFLLNRYGNSAISDWDGNHVSIDKDGCGVILAPQMGAGHKENDNSFTGVLMGSVKETGKGITEIGLLGYNYGTRSFFINSKDGSATFGQQGSGQLKIDPSQKKALIYSSDYWKNYDLYGNPINYTDENKNNAGMLIDLTTPKIEFGNGNFIVTKEGHLTAKGGGSIAGWQISDTKLTGGNVTINSNGNIGCIVEEKGTIIKDDGSTETVTKKVQKWSINNDGSANFGGLSIDTNGNLTAYNGKFIGGQLLLQDNGTNADAAIKIQTIKEIQDSNNSTIQRVTRETTYSGYGIEADIFPDYEYTDEKVGEAYDRLIINKEEASDDDKRMYDVNGDGKVDEEDFAIITWLRYLGITKETPGHFSIDTHASFHNNISITDGQGRKIVGMGLGGIEAYAGNLYYVEGESYGPITFAGGGYVTSGGTEFQLGTIFVPKSLADIKCVNLVAGAKFKVRQNGNYLVGSATEGFPLDSFKDIKCQKVGDNAISVRCILSSAPKGVVNNDTISVTVSGLAFKFTNSPL